MHIQTLHVYSSHGHIMQCELKTAKLFTNVHYANTVFQLNDHHFWSVRLYTIHYNTIQ